jgi:uncharacterized protein (DUF1330 family)
VSVYLVARGRITDQDTHDEYVARAVETLPSDARIVAFDLASEVVEGELADTRTVIIEFSSRDSFRAWYDSEAYQAVLPLRLSSVPGGLAVVDAYIPES